MNKQRPILHAVMIAVIVGAAAEASAQYVPAEEQTSRDHPEWLYNAISSGIESGVKSVTKDILTNIGSAILSSYSSAISDLIFGGGGSELNAIKEAIIDEIQITHSDLAARNREILDELEAQYHADIDALLSNASLDYRAWLANSDLPTRHVSLDILVGARKALGDVRSHVQDYILRDGGNATVRLRMRRLHLIEYHIAATKLLLQVDADYWSTVATYVAFDSSPYGGSFMNYDAWVSSLTEEDIDNINADVVSSMYTAREVINDVNAFYHEIAAIDDVSAYVYGVMTPIAHQNNEFQPSTALYDNIDVTMDPASWEIEYNHGALPYRATTVVSILDAPRWFYYVDIPRASCLEGLAFDDLRSSVIPWAEDVSNAALSPCNRFWIAADTQGYDGYRMSFDQYEVLFPDPLVAHELHERLLIGDITREIYGPASLMLDEINREYLGATRAPNAWDERFIVYDEDIATLAAAANYDVSLDAREVIEWVGNDSRTLGLADFAEALQTLAADWDDASLSVQATVLASESDWLSPRDGTLDPVRLRYVLLDEEGVLAHVHESGSWEDFYAWLQARMRSDAAAKFVALM